MKALKFNKEWRSLIDHAQANGWTVTRTKGDHLRFQGPQGQLVFGASTPSDAKRALKNTESLLRRRGLHPVTPQRKKKTP